MNRKNELHTTVEDLCSKSRWKFVVDESETAGDCLTESPRTKVPLRFQDEIDLLEQAVGSVSEGPLSVNVHQYTPDTGPGGARLLGERIRC